jgi:hypothetical protein
MNFDPTAPPDTRIVEASLIRKTISDGHPVQIQHGIIRGGPLAFDSLRCQQKLSLLNCVIEERAIFSFSAFEKNVDFTGTEFRRGAHFESTDLKQDLVLNGCQFTGGDFAFDDSVVRGRFFCGSVSFGRTVTVSFESARFMRKAIFSESIFGQRASFRNASFASRAEFSSVSFLSEVDFSGMSCAGEIRFDRNTSGSAVSSTFRSSADFNDIKVAGCSHFEDCRFMSSASFKQAAFSKDVFFQGVVFDQGVSFFGSQFGPGEFYGLVCRGKADFSGAIFEGDVSFERNPNGNSPPAEFGGNADFTGAEIRGQFSFQGVVVRGDGSFNGAMIKSDAYFDSENAGRGGCTIEGEADFIGLQVGGDAVFDDSHFEKGIALKRAHLLQNGYFRRCLFKGIAELSGVEIGGDFQANDSEFQHNANFQGARFRGEAQFQATKFKGQANFIDCEFGALALFSGEIPQHPTLFQIVTFEHSRFLGNARFERCLFEGPASFADASFRSLIFEKESQQFASTVNLSGCKYERIVTNWKHLLFIGGRSRLAPYDRAAGIQLENALRKIGEDGKATDLYLRRKSVERREKWKKREYLPWFADLMYKAFANYGARPRALFLSAALLVAAGTFLFSYPSTVVLAQPKKGDLNSPVSWSRLKALGVSIHQFLPIDVPVGSEWKPSPELLNISVANRRIVSSCIRPTFLATVLLRIPGWLLVPLGVASLAGVLRRSENSHSVAETT